MTALIVADLIREVRLSTLRIFINRERKNNFSNYEHIIVGFYYSGIHFTQKKSIVHLIITTAINNNQNDLYALI